MNEAPPTPARSGPQRAVVLTLIACLALSAWSILHIRRPASGIKSSPAPALKSQPRPRTKLSLDPEPVCVQTSSVTRATNDA